MFRAALLTLAFLATHAATALGCEELAPWSRLSATANHTFTPLPLSLAISSPLAPLLMAPTGADYELHLFAQRDLHGRPNAESISVYTPFVFPLVVAGVDGIAHAVDACAIARPSSAMLQAMGISLVLVTSLKFVTGRSWPSGGLDPNAPGYLYHPEFSRRFHWFSWNQGTAWPSGHTAIMVAAASALSTVEGARSWVGYAAYLAAGGVAAGMWLGDHHWASDIVSGALIGVGIGRGAGLAFREQASTTNKPSMLLVPMLGGAVSGLQLVGSW